MRWFCGLNNFITNTMKSTWYYIHSNFTDVFEEEEFLICHIHNYTPYNLQWNLCSAFNPSKCTHTWSSEQLTMQRPGSSWVFGALLKGLTSVMENSCRSRDSNPQPRVTSPTLYPLEPQLPLLHVFLRVWGKLLLKVMHYNLALLH